MATEEPVEPEPWPVVLVMLLSCWLRTASAASCAAVRLVDVLAPLDRDPPAAALVAVPEKAAAETAEVWVPLTTARGRDIDVAQRFRALPELRRHFHDHVILVLVLVDGRDGALAERVVQRVVHL